MTERIQKVLARAGVGSRRQVEQWIKEGRLSINGAAVTPGTKIGPRDRIALDGRAVRMREEKSTAATVVYHRAAKSSLKRNEEASSPELLAQLPGGAGRRWVPISPLPIGDSGLELLTTDGNLAHAMTRRFSQMRMEFALRICGDPRLDQLERLKSGVIGEGEETLTVEALELEGGEGVNRWFKLVTQGARARAVHQLCEVAGVQLSRLIRVGFGPILMDRRLSRGKVRPLEPQEMAELYALAELPLPVVGPEQPQKRAKKKASQRAKKTVRRKRS